MRLTTGTAYAIAASIATTMNAIVIDFIFTEKKTKKAKGKKSQKKGKKKKQRVYGTGDAECFCCCFPLPSNNPAFVFNVLIVTSVYAYHCIDICHYVFLFRLW